MFENTKSHGSYKTIKSYSLFLAKFYHFTGYMHVLLFLTFATYIFRDLYIYKVYINIRYNVYTKECSKNSG